MSGAVALHAPDSPRFHEALAAILGREPDEALRPALPYSAVVENCSSQAIALVGVRFSMTGRRGRNMSVIHFADTLRNPERTEFAPGAFRFFCAEPAYAAMAIRGTSEPGLRATMNLKNLRSMVSVRASVDCFAFDDGRFLGPDTGGAFERFAKQRASEQAMIAEVISGQLTEQNLPKQLNSSDPARRALARKLCDALGAGGGEAMLECARKHRCRIELVKA